jgi:hypothetical protein
VESGTPTAWVPQSKPIWFTELGCPAIDRGTNQPNVFFDPKSSESFTPYFSRGWRDDAIQRAYLEATYLWWGQGGEQPDLLGLWRPDGACAGMRRLDLGRAALSVLSRTDRCLDRWPELAARALADRAAGRGVAGGPRAPPLPARRAARGIDRRLRPLGRGRGLCDLALEAPRASISTLARHFGFDAVESEGVHPFLMRGRAPVATVTPDSMVAPPREGDVMELTRAQETELPQALKWQVARADEDYDAAQVEARRITVDTTRIASESFPMAIPPEEAERRCRRALMEAWVGRESAVFRLPPSRLALDPRRDPAAFAGDNWALTEVPLGEAAEGYEIDILNGAVVLRSVAGLTAPAFTYTAAMQTADFGAPLSGPLSVRIAQVGAMGRGAILDITL